MNAPVLVRAYTSTIDSSPNPTRIRSREVEALPAVSSYAFADILRSVDCSDFQSAIDGIAELCAKNRMSLSDEYASHMPPLGEITAASSVAVRPHLSRPGLRRPLTSVPEASSSSSESSRKSMRKRAIFGFRRQQYQVGNTVRQIRIGSMGRTVSVGSTVALAANEDTHSDGLGITSSLPADQQRLQRPTAQRTGSDAMTSLQRLLGHSETVTSG